MIKAELNGEVWALDGLREALKQEDDFELTISSLGGSSLEGLTTARVIQGRAKSTTAKILGIAASAAATIALACDKVVMTKSDALMLHHCWGWAVGNKEELAEEIEAMTALDTMLDNIMTAHCKDDTIQNKLNEGKDIWLTGEQALEMFDHVELVEASSEGKQSNTAMTDLVHKAQKADDLESRLDEEKASKDFFGKQFENAQKELEATRSELAQAKAELEKSAEEIEKYKKVAENYNQLVKRFMEA